MTPSIEPALRKIKESGAHPIEIEAFGRRFEQLVDAGQGQTLAGDELQPVGELPRLEDLPNPSSDEVKNAFNQLAVLKLNGGLGTSMGLSGPKSLLPVKDNKSFLDIIALQILALRKEYAGGLPLLLMNSRSTRGPSLELLSRYEGLAEQAVPLDFLQGLEPKLRADDFSPVSWPANPELEWCPPGHGDVYVALRASGVLEKLLEVGIRWCFVSNADNLGAIPDGRIAKWVTSQQIPFLMEAVRGTPADRKGGHLATRDGRFVLRESAQVPAEDNSFGNVRYWKYFNTNNLWFDLSVIKQMQELDPVAPALPLIVNRKTVDPTDSGSADVLQLEAAMGAAIGSIEGAQALEIPRTRFAPVKTTDDLLVNRSDAYALLHDGRMEPSFSGPPPVVALDTRYFGRVTDFEDRFPTGPPSLKNCDRLEVRGDVVFGRSVEATGNILIEGPRVIEDFKKLGGNDGG